MYCSLNPTDKHNIQLYDQDTNMLRHNGNFREISPYINQNQSINNPNSTQFNNNNNFNANNFLYGDRNRDTNN